MSRPASFWLCHECHAEMRPIQRDGVSHCASCDSEFIESLDPEVNPRPLPSPDEPPDHSGFLQTMFSSLLSAAHPNDPGTSRGQRQFAFNIPGGGQGSIVVGMGGRQGAQGLDAFFPGFAPPPGRQGDVPPGDDILGALFQMLAQEGTLPNGMGNPGAMGDYVMTENGFDQIMEQLMHAAGPQGPLPATEAVIEGLPRVTFDEESLDASVYKDCPICKDDFAAGDEAMRIPCAHVFHPDCLQPWLKTNGSCPVCRFSLVPDEANQPAPTSDQPAQPEGQPLLTNILNRLWGQRGAPPSPATEVPRSTGTGGEVARGSVDGEEGSSNARGDTSRAGDPSETDDPPVPSLSSAIPEDYRARHRRREREREEEYPSYFS